MPDTIDYIILFNMFKSNTTSGLPNNWSDDKIRLVLYADLMGFKSKVYGSSHKKLKEEIYDFHNKWLKKVKPLQIGEHLRFVQFSDSILIAVNGINNKMFNLISKASVSLMHIAMESHLPIKGVIAQGIFSYDKENELYLGRPLVDAVLLHDEVKFYGIVVHHTAEETVKKYRNIKNPYNNSPIYLEKGKTSHYHLCWNLLNQTLSPEDITQICEKWLEDIAERVSGYPRIYIDRTLEVLREDSSEFKKY